MHRIDGTGHWDVPLPETCHFVPRDAAGIAGASPDGMHVYFAVTSPDTRVALLHHDVRTRTTDVVFRSGTATALEIRSDVVWARSEDGTAVPMTLVRSARAEHNGAPAVIVEGYGGGGDSMRPFDFVPWKVAWLERGGVIASAHLRGGSELGADWMLAATRAGKLLAMQDFVACAAHLVDTGFTVPAHVGITGRSSGAMLAAAAVVARPDLFGACVAEVGMFDPLRYHLFGLGSLMIDEYGTSDDARDFAAMHAYSPYHNVRPGTEYPAFLLTVHDDDDRVAPGGAYKFTAALQAAQHGTAPILLRRRSGAGHHGGDVTGDVAEYADIVAFFAAELGLA
jgi:prolyl oligopeptidase